MNPNNKIRMAFALLPSYPGNTGDSHVSRNDDQACDVALARDILGNVIKYSMDGDCLSNIYQDNYEAGLVSEARLIAEEKSNKTPTKEHLRILLKWLDGSHPDSDDKPF